MNRETCVKRNKAINAVAALTVALPWLAYGSLWLNTLQVVQTIPTNATISKDSNGLK